MDKNIQIDYSKFSEDSLWSPGGIKWQTNLKAHHFDPNGNSINLYDLGPGLITTAGVHYLASSWTGANLSISSFAWHDSGTSSTAATVNDSGVSRPPTGISPRAQGTQTNPVTAVMQSVATQSYTASMNIVEWGLFSALTGGTMWDRKTFTSIGVASGDSIQFTYTLSVSAGG